ncbi:hypothetical protein GAT18_26665 [Phocaeicola vulgatus]|nr:hypothetical protein GAT18_26665 [Phocaeicola vulgatus]
MPAKAVCSTEEVGTEELTTFVSATTDSGCTPLTFSDDTTLSTAIDEVTNVASSKANACTGIADNCISALNALAQKRFPNNFTMDPPVCNAFPKSTQKCHD